MFTALSVGSGFALLFVPNVELITAVVFVSGVSLGPGWGLTVGVLSELVFSTANPLGSGLVFLPLLASQLVGMGLVGLTGGLLRRGFRTRNWPMPKVILIGATGAVLTFLFDTFTTLSYPLAMGFEFRQTAAIYVTGMGFTVLHQLSNALIFATALPQVFRRIHVGNEVP